MNFHARLRVFTLFGSPVALGDALVSRSSAQTGPKFAACGHGQPSRHPRHRPTASQAEIAGSASINIARRALPGRLTAAEQIQVYVRTRSSGRPTVPVKHCVHEQLKRREWVPRYRELTAARRSGQSARDVSAVLSPCPRWLSTLVADAQGSSQILAPTA